MKYVVKKKYRERLASAFLRALLVQGAVPLGKSTRRGAGARDRARSGRSPGGPAEGARAADATTSSAQTPRSKELRTLRVLS